MDKIKRPINEGSFELFIDESWLTMHETSDLGKKSEFVICFSTLSLLIYNEIVVSLLNVFGVISNVSIVQILSGIWRSNWQQFICSFPTLILKHTLLSVIYALHDWFSE